MHSQLRQTRKDNRSSVSLALHAKTLWEVRTEENSICVGGEQNQTKTASWRTIRSLYNITCVCWLSKVISSKLSEDIANALRNHSDRLLRHAPATKENCPKSLLLQYKIILAARRNCGRMTSNWSQTFRRMSPPGFVQQRTAKAVA